MRQVVRELRLHHQQVEGFAPELGSRTDDEVLQNIFAAQQKARRGLALACAGSLACAGKDDRGVCPPRHGQPALPRHSTTAAKRDVHDVQAFESSAFLNLQRLSQMDMLFHSSLPNNAVAESSDDQRRDEQGQKHREARGAR